MTQQFQDALDEFYYPIDSSFKVLNGYMDDVSFETTFKACRLKPYDFIKPHPKTKTQLFRYWIDEYGNSLEINRKRKIKITYGDLRFDRRTFDHYKTDMYYGLSLKSVVKISSSIMVIAGKDEDTNGECFLVSLLGLDKYLRAYLFCLGKWQQVSPLLLGWENVRWAMSENPEKMPPPNKKNCPTPCASVRSCLHLLPMNENAQIEIGKLGVFR